MNKKLDILLEIMKLPLSPNESFERELRTVTTKALISFVKEEEKPVPTQKKKVKQTKQKGESNE